MGFKRIGFRRLFCQQSSPIIDPRTYEKLSRDFVDKVTLSPILQSLKTAKQIRIHQNPILDACIGVNGQPLIDDVYLAPDVIFIRWFFEELFGLIRQNHRVILLGNPGISKSIFQYFMLHRFLSGAPLPPDSFGSTQAPKIIIRQVRTQFQIWDLQKGTVFGHLASPDLLGCFDPTQCLYLFEPEGTLETPFFGGLLIPTVCTVSPDVRRYKEFRKNGGVEVYMPIWTLPELQAVRDFLAERNTKGLPTKKEIDSRFREFGGIFRHVFTHDLKSLREQQRAAILALDPSKLLWNSIDRQDISHHIAQYRIPTTGANAFREWNIDFISDEAMKKVKAQLKKLSLDEKRRLLMKNDENSMFMEKQSAVWFEELIAESLISLSGVSWRRRVVSDGNNQFSDFPLRLIKLEEGKPPFFEKMKTEVLYKSLNGNYPAVDLMFKTNEGFLYGLQITRRQDKRRQIEGSAVDKWLKLVDMKDRTKVRIVVIPKPELAEKFTVGYDPTDPTDPTSHPPTLELWWIPRDYGVKFTEE